MTEPLMHGMQQMQSAGDADRSCPQSCLAPLHDVPGVIFEVISICSRRGCFPSVETEERLIFGIPVEHECAATNSRRLGLHKIQDKLCRYSCVDSGTTTFEYGVCRLGRKRMGSDGHELVCKYRFFRLPTSRRFRFRHRGGCRCNHGSGKEQDEPREYCSIN